MLVDLFESHNTVRAQLHFNVCKEIGAKLGNENWYDHVQTCREDKVDLLWNQKMQTDRTIPNNKPAIVVHDNEKGTRMLIDVAIFGERNVLNT